MSHSASRKRASSLDALLYWESSRRPNRVPRTRRRMRAFARVAATPRVRVSLRSRMPYALFWQVCPIWRHRYSEPMEAISLMVSRTALLAPSTFAGWLWASASRKLMHTAYFTILGARGHCKSLSAHDIVLYFLRSQCPTLNRRKRRRALGGGTRWPCGP